MSQYMGKLEKYIQRDVTYEFLPAEWVEGHLFTTEVILKRRVVCKACDCFFTYGSLAGHLAVCACIPGNPNYDETNIEKCECGGKYLNIKTHKGHHSRNTRHKEYIAEKRK